MSLHYLGKHEPRKWCLLVMLYTVFLKRHCFGLLYPRQSLANFNYFFSRDFTDCSMAMRLVFLAQHQFVTRSTLSSAAAGTTVDGPSNPQLLQQLVDASYVPSFALQIMYLVATVDVFGRRKHLTIRHCTNRWQQQVIKRSYKAKGATYLKPMDLTVNWPMWTDWLISFSVHTNMKITRGISTFYRHAAAANSLKIAQSTQPVCMENRAHWIDGVEFCKKTSDVILLMSRWTTSSGGAVPHVRCCALD